MFILFFKNIMRIYYITIFKKNIYFFIYWLRCVLLLCVGYSLVVESGGYSLLVVHRLLIVVASLVEVHRLWGSQASVVVVQWGQVPHDMWNPPGPGIEPVCSALADGLLTIRPPGKSCMFKVKVSGRHTVVYAYRKENQNK